MKFIHSLRDKLNWFFSIALLFSSVVTIAQIEPQFKFYLAFEDANYQRDTVWIIIDSSATEGFTDTLLGEIIEPIDSSKFQTWLFGTSDSTGYKTWCYPFRVINHYATDIKSRNAQAPILMRWDKNILNNNNLPFQVKRAWTQSNYFSVFFAEELDLLTSDSVILEPFFEGGGPGQHFPLTVLFLDKLQGVGINESNKQQFSIYPNPSYDQLTITLKNNSNYSFRILNLSGQILKTGTISDAHKKIDISALIAGYYLISITQDSRTSYEKFIISK